MQEITTKKIHVISGYMNKSEISKFLGICRATLYTRLDSHEWSEKQIEKVNYLYGLIESIKDIKKIRVEDNKLSFYFIKIQKEIYPI